MAVDSLSSAMAVAPTVLTNPQSFAATRSAVLVGEIGDTALKVFDAASGAMIAAAGRRGEGPGEFRSAWAVDAIQVGDSTAVWVYDSRLNRVSAYSFGASGLLTHRHPAIRLGVASVDAIRALSESTFVLAGSFPDSRLKLVGLGGSVFKAVGEIPLRSKGVPINVVLDALQPTIAVNRGTSQVAVAARYAGRLDIYSLHTGRRTEARVPQPFSPRLRVAERKDLAILVQDGQTQFGYVSVAADHDRIYALYSGRTRSKSPGTAHSGNLLDVFDWNGGFVRRLVLDRDLVAVSTNGSGRLYGLAVDGAGAVIWSFRLP